MGISQAWKLIVQALKMCWDNLTTIVLLNLLWFFFSLAPVFLSSLISEDITLFIMAAILALLLIGPVTSASQYLLSLLVNREEITVADFTSAFKKFFWRSELLVIIGLAVLIFMVFNFSISVENPAWYVRLLSGIWLYFVLFWLLVLQYIFPLLVQQDIGLLLALKRASLLVLDNLLISLMFLILCGIISFISIYLVIPLVIIWFAMIGLMQNYIVVELLKKYDKGHSHQ